MIVLKSFVISVVSLLLLVTHSVAQPNNSYLLYTGGTNLAVARQPGSSSGTGDCDNISHEYYFQSVSNSHLKYTPSIVSYYGNISLTANVTPGTYQIKYMEEENIDEYDYYYGCMTNTWNSQVKLVTVTVEKFLFTSTPPSSVNHFCGRVDFGTYLPLSGVTWTVVTANGGSFTGNVYTTGTATGSVTVKGTKVYDNGTATITHTFTMANPVTVTTSNSTPEVGEEVVFTSSISAAVDYMWDFGDGGSMGNSTGYHYYYEPGPKTIKLTMTAATGPTCTRTYTFSNKVNIQTTDIITGSENPNTGKVVKVFPVPFADYLTIQASQDLTATINLRNISSSSVIEVADIRIKAGENIINTSTIPAGVYIMQLTQGDYMQTFKVVKY